MKKRVGLNSILISSEDNFKKNENESKDLIFDLENFLNYNIIVIKISPFTKSKKNFIFRNLKDLEIIKFDSNPELDKGDFSIEKLSISSLPNLSVVLANHCNLNFVEINNCNNILELRLGNNLISNLNFLSEKLDNLEILSIHSNNIKDKNNLKILSNLKNLKKLYIDNVSSIKNKGNYFGNEKLNFLDRYKKLKFLDLSNCGFDLSDISSIIANKCVFICSEEEGSKIIEENKEHFIKTEESKIYFDFNFEMKNNSWEFYEDKKIKNLDLWKNMGFTPYEVTRIFFPMRVEDPHLAKFLKEKKAINIWVSPFYNLSKIDLMTEFNVRKFDDSKILSSINNDSHSNLKELDINSQKIYGEININNLVKLVRFCCSNNCIDSLIAYECQNLLFIDISDNKIKNLTLPKNISLKEFYARDNLIEDLSFLNRGNISESLIICDLNFNNLKKLEISYFNSFSNLEILNLGNFSSSKIKKNFILNNESLELVSLIIIDISNLDFNDNYEFIKKNKLPSLEEIYFNYFDEKNTDIFYVKYKKQEIEIITKIPSSLIPERKINETINSSEDFFLENELIFPLYINFSFENINNRRIRFFELPLKLCEVVDFSNKEYKLVKRENLNFDNRFEYATVSYAWGTVRDKKSSLTNLAKQALKKVLEFFRIVNSNFLKNINYFWMDQICVDQNNNQEKMKEIPRMGMYYRNSSLNLVPININLGKELIIKLNESLKKDNGYINIKSIFPICSEIIKIILSSEWADRAWTLQEAHLSSRIIFLFNDYFIDGGFLSLFFYLIKFPKIHYEKCKNIKDLCKKATTPLGLVYYEQGYNNNDKIYLSLNQAILAVKDRKKTAPLDAIYSIIGLLPYGNKIKVDYNKEMENVLLEIMMISAKYGYGDIISWFGRGSFTYGLSSLPMISNDSIEINGFINIIKNNNFNDFFSPEKGIKLRAREYLISEIKISDFIYSSEIEDSIKGGLWNRKINVIVDEKQLELTLSGTFSTMKALSKGRTLIIPIKEEWEYLNNDNHFFAILSIKINSSDENLRHRIDLVLVKNFFSEQPYQDYYIC